MAPAMYRITRLKALNFVMQLSATCTVHMQANTVRGPIGYMRRAPAGNASVTQ